VCLSDLKQLAVLGTGGFGMVTLVQHRQARWAAALP
jgi:hypothetical protein